MTMMIFGCECHEWPTTKPAPMLCPDCGRAVCFRGEPTEEQRREAVVPRGCGNPPGVRERKP